MAATAKNEGRQGQGWRVTIICFLSALSKRERSYVAVNENCIRHDWLTNCAQPVGTVVQPVPPPAPPLAGVGRRPGMSAGEVGLVSPHGAISPSTHNVPGPGGTLVEEAAAPQRVMAGPWHSSRGLPSQPGLACASQAAAPLFPWKDHPRRRPRRQSGVTRRGDEHTAAPWPTAHGRQHRPRRPGLLGPGLCRPPWAAAAAGGRGAAATRWPGSGRHLGGPGAGSLPSRATGPQAVTGGGAGWGGGRSRCRLAWARLAACPAACPPLPSAASRLRLSSAAAPPACSQGILSLGCLRGARGEIEVRWLPQGGRKSSNNWKCRTAALEASCRDLSCWIYPSQRGKCLR